MNKKKIYKNYEELLSEELKDQKLALAYLNNALAEDDPKVFLIALKDVLEAQKSNFSNIAKEAHVTRQNLYRMLSDKGNPRWNNLSSLFGALGFQVQLSFKNL